MMEPRYGEIKASDIPDVVLDSGAHVKVSCGMVDGITGPVQNIIAEPEYIDIVVPPCSHLSYHIKDGYTAMAYILDGAACFD